MYKKCSNDYEKEKMAIFMAINISSFVDILVYKKRIDELIEKIKKLNLKGE